MDSEDIYYLENIEQLEVISDPLRYRMYFSMLKPKTGAQLARALKISRARAHYHLNILKDAGLVEFRQEKLSSHGITEKYYQAIAHYLDFSRLLPQGRDLAPDKVTLRSFQVATKFLANLLDSSREGLAHLKAYDGLGIGFHSSLDLELTPEQFTAIKQDLCRIKDRLIEMDRANARSDEPSLVNCKATLFLTPQSDDPLETE